MILTLARKLQEIYWKIFKPKRSGAQVIIYEDNSIILVKHSYTDSWYFPGGGKKKNETFKETAKREAFEEIGIKVKNLRLFGEYQNTKEGKRDTIKVYLCRQKFDLSEVKKDRETNEVKIFNLNNLPTDMSPGTGRRIVEFKSGKYPTTGE